MGVQLSVRLRDGDSDGGAVIYEFDQDRILIGRGGGADVSLPHASVSAKHATIEQRGGRYAIVDHGTTNGTFVQGARLAPERPKPLRDGDLLEIGAFTLSWKQGVAVLRSPTAERTVSLARRLLRTVLATDAPRPARLVVVHGADRGRELAIPAPPARLSIGRGEHCDLVLSDPDASREHVELWVDLDGVVARDLGSKNGLVIGDRALDDKRLVDRDELRIGESILLFEDDAAQALRAAEQSPDERLPTRSEPPSPALSSADDDPDAPTGDERASAPSSVAAKPPPSSAQLGGAELLVFALASAVFFASAVGLYLLMRAS